MKEKIRYLQCTLYLYDKEKKTVDKDYRETIDLLLNKKLIWYDSNDGDRIAIYIGNFYEIYNKENNLIKNLDALGILNYNTKTRYINDDKVVNNFCNII